MPVILNIDTSVDTASVCLSENDDLIALAINTNQKDHAAWLHGAIQELLENTRKSLDDLDAVAISIGPGSYTGLRIGLSAAKGLCYALDIPLICINTLLMMAHAVKKEGVQLICPLIDARRMEVFAAIYSKSLEEIKKPFSLVITSDSFSELLSSDRVIFCGNGSKKLQGVLCHDNAIFDDAVATAADLRNFANNYYHQKKFANLAYSEPYYLKEFYFRAR
jgi:tRNA threonylcarbamoyladenosine biosynthesis protein TsaB